MKEIEVKIMNIDTKKIRNQLKLLGAKKVFSGEIQALSFDFENLELKQAGKSLRLRKMGDKVEFCFKGRNESKIFKAKEEIEVNTSDFAKTRKILENLGLNQIKEYHKCRESYQLGKVKFELDTYPDFPAFLEIEAPSEEEVKEWVLKLNYTMEQTTNLTIGELRCQKK